MTDTPKPPAVISPAPPPIQPTAGAAAKAVGAITSANLPPEIPPPGQKELAPLEIHDDSDIVAKPLVSPDFTKLKPVNPAMSLRLVNRLALGGQRFEEAKVQGFIVCGAKDIKDCPSLMNVKDGTVTYGDLIVMMMPRADYLGAIKNNENNARARTAKAAVFGAGQEHLAQALNEVHGSRENKSKVKLFSPDR
jgi:hypothetical protein